MNASTISIIVDTVAALFSAGAIGTAIYVYKKTAALQRKAINYSLLENRIKIWKYFENDKDKVESTIKRYLEGRDWEIEKFKLLFSKEIVREYDSIAAESKRIEELLKQIIALEFARGNQIAITEGINDSKLPKRQAIKNKREEMTAKDFSKKDQEELKLLCEDYFDSQQCGDYLLKIQLYIESKKALDKRNKQFIQHITDEIKSSLEFESDDNNL